MPGARPVVYWDTCVILAWIQDENRKAGEMEGIRYFVSKIDNNEIIMITSAIYRTEILDSKINNDAKEKLDQLFKKRNVKSIPADTRINDLASEIRDHYQLQRDIDGKPGLATPDAIHLATAIHFQADEFHTFDEDDDGGTRGLLPLNGSVAGHILVITKPTAEEPEFDLGR